MSSSPDFLHSPLRFYLECGRSIHYVRIFLAEVIIVTKDAPHVMLTV